MSKRRQKNNDLNLQTRYKGERTIDQKNDGSARKGGKNSPNMIKKDRLLKYPALYPQGTENAFAAGRKEGNRLLTKTIFEQVNKKKENP